MDDNLFEVLQISEEAKSQEIKKAYFTLVKKYSPDNEPVKFERIRHAYEVLKDEKSRLKYIEMKNISPNVRALFEDSMRYKEAENFDEAVKLLKKVVKFEPENDFIAKNLADAYMKNGEFGKANKIYETLSLKYPDNTVYVVNIARAYKARGWFKKAIPYYEKIYKLEESSAEIIIDLADCYSLAKKFDLARDLLLQVLETNKDKNILDKDNFNKLFKVLFELDAKNKYKYFNRDYETFISFMTEDKNKLELYRNSVFEVLNVFLVYKHYEMIKKLLEFMENCGLKLAEYEIVHIKSVRLLVENQKIAMDNRIKKEIIELISIYSIILTNKENSNELATFDDETMEMFCIKNKIMVLENVPDIEKQFEIIEIDYQFCKEAIQDFIEEIKCTKNKNYLLNKYKSKYEKKYKAYDENFSDVFDPKFDDFLLHDSDDEDCENYDFFETQEPYKREEPKIGRNDPCPCGSGKKYKKCCGK